MFLSEKSAGCTTNWLQWREKQHPNNFLRWVWEGNTLALKDERKKERKPLNCVWLFATPFLAHGIFQAWILEWVVISFSRVSSQPRYQTQVSHNCRQILYRLSHQGNLKDENTVFACWPQFTSGIFLCSTQHWTYTLGTNWTFPWRKLCESEVAHLCMTLCNSMDCSLPSSYVHGIFQARVLEWVAISFSSSLCNQWHIHTAHYNLGVGLDEVIVRRLKHSVYFRNVTWLHQELTVVNKKSAPTVVSLVGVSVKHSSFPRVRTLCQ